MNGDSRGVRDVLGRGGTAFCGVLSLLALALGGCAVSFEDGNGRRQVAGFFSMAVDTPERQAPTDAARHFTFYGVWFDDTFRGTSIALGEVELSVADLRNQWHRDGEAVTAATPEEDGTASFGFRWCTLAARDPSRAGEAFDIAISGISIGAGARDRHFGVGYHRQVLLEVTNENALVAWPADVKLEGLLRGSFNG